MRIVKIVSLLFCLLFSAEMKAQDLDEGSNLWTSNYVFVRLNSRLSIDNFSLSSFNLQRGGQFGFFQNETGFNFDLNRSNRVFVTYSNAQYNFRSIYRDLYDLEPNVFNRFTVHRFGIGYQHRHRFNRNWRMANKLVAQYYIPTLEKYRFRWMYVNTLEYRHRKLPMDLRPFTQLYLYYYSGGLDFEYASSEPNEEGEFFELASPNGLHRFRWRGGFSFKPVPAWDFLSVKAYFALQREFNTPWGRDLNVRAQFENDDGDVEEITGLPFNNFRIWGLQLNLVF